MSKLFCLVSSCVDTFSGYGARSRDLALSLLKLKKEEWDIRFLSQRWGNCPFGYLETEKEKYQEVIERLIGHEQVTKQPDIFINISVSNEFQPVGKVNIGISALVETTILPGDMIEGLNRMTFNIVSSEHCKKVAVETTFDRVNNQTNQKEGILKLEKPVHVLFEGCDLNVYNPAIIDKGELTEYINDEVKEEFAFLTVGHWLQGDHMTGADRKGLADLIKVFLMTFKDQRTAPALILKTSGATYSYMDRDIILGKIDEIRRTIKAKTYPNIYLIHGELRESEMNELYNHSKVKAFAMPGANEGFGRPFLEFSAASSKPVIASPFSGHIDFLDKEFNVFVGGVVTDIHPSSVNQFALKESKWFKANPDEISAALKDVYENYKNYVEKGKRQGYRSRTYFSLDKMTEKLKEILDTSLPKLSVPVSIKLPKLADINK